jgi:hypothetical protein
VKTQIVVTAFLLFAAQSSSSIERRATPSTEVVFERTPTLQITFDDREGGQFGDEDKLLIRKIAAEAEKKVQVLPDHNHLFQKTTSGAPSAYEALGSPFADGLLSIVRSWLSRNQAQMENTD